MPIQFCPMCGKPKDEMFYVLKLDGKTIVCDECGELDRKRYKQIKEQFGESEEE